MAKYYVQCASYSLIIDAADAAAAAMHLIDTAMQPHLWIYDDSGLSQQDRHDHLMLEALLHLGPEITVSEQGFHRPDARRVGTPDTVSAWHRTMAGVSNLLVSVGLVPRSLRQLAEVPPRSNSASAGNPFSLQPIRKPR